jgi:hypothetical protein
MLWAGLKDRLLMPECYAKVLNECDGPLEDEHFIPLILQDMIGPVTVGGFAWQKQSLINLAPGSYAHSRIICQRHHDLLNGFDGNAAAYFRNLMFIANPVHLATGRSGSQEDIAELIDGRALEKWLLKTICGAIASNSIEDVNEVPDEWVQALFDHIPWPEEWAMYVETVEMRQTKVEDARLQLDFAWTADRRLNGLILRFLSVATLFALEPPDDVTGFLKQPRVLIASIDRPDGGDVLVGVPKGEPLPFQISWPHKSRLDLNALGLGQREDRRGMAG